MGIKNCPQCGKLFVETPTDLCPDCYAELQQDEAKVGEYLRKVGKSSVPEIHRATGVKEKVIMRMIKQGRIISEFKVFYPCEVCGNLIDVGRLCPACSRNITDQIKEGEQKKAEQEPKRGGRMYTRELE